MQKSDRMMYYSARACIFIMAVMMLMVLGRYITKNLLFDRWNMRNAVTDFFLYNEIEYYDNRENETSGKAKVNWSEKYPFETVSAEIPESLTKEKSGFEDKISFIKKQLEQYCTSLLVSYETCVELAVEYEKMIGWDCTVNMGNEGVPLKNGYFTSLSMTCDVTDAAYSLGSLHSYLQSENIDMIYAAAPNKVSKYGESGLSPIYTSGVNGNLDAIVKAEKAKGIDVLDYREVIYDAGLEYLPLFFKTDHHWKPQTGLWAAGVLGEYLNENYQFQIDTEKMQLNNYNQKVYKDYFLGSTGRKVTLAKAEPDDITILTPKFDTSLTVNEKDKGTFEETLINYNVLSMIDYYNRNPYTAYGHGDLPLLEIHNNNLTDGKKVLVVKDSYGNVVVPFMALGIEYVSAIDLRYFTGSLQSYIKEYQPDVVIVLYTGVGEIDEKEYASHTSLWDFR